MIEDGGELGDDARQRGDLHVAVIAKVQPQRVRQRHQRAARHLVLRGEFGDGDGDDVETVGVHGGVGGEVRARLELDPDVQQVDHEVTVGDVALSEVLEDRGEEVRALCGQDVPSG